MTGLVELPQRVRRGGTIRFFFDEDTLGIGQVMAAARGDCIYPGHPRSPVNVGTDDVDWIPAVAAEGWIVVARDNKIRSRPAEMGGPSRAPAPHAGAYNGAGNLSVWEQLRVLVARWDRIEELSLEPPPWMYAVTKNGLREIRCPG